MSFFNETVKSGYFMYMAEASGMDGLVSTRTAKVNAAIKDFKYIVSQGHNPNFYIEEVLAKHGLSEDNLTDRECRQIMEAINGH